MDESKSVMQSCIHAANKNVADASTKAIEYRKCQQKAYEIIRKSLKKTDLEGKDDKHVDTADFERIITEGAKRTISNTMANCMKTQTTDSDICIQNAHEKAKAALEAVQAACVTGAECELELLDNSREKLPDTIVRRVGHVLLAELPDRILWRGV